MTRVARVQGRKGGEHPGCDVERRSDGSGEGEWNHEEWKSAWKITRRTYDN